jgi:hypothetical protein
MTPRDALVSAIAFALIRCRPHLRVLAQRHTRDEARQMVAEIIAEQIERSGLEVRQKPPARSQSTPPLASAGAIRNTEERGGRRDAVPGHAPSPSRPRVRCIGGITTNKNPRDPRHDRPEAPL